MNVRKWARYGVVVAGASLILVSGYRMASYYIDAHNSEKRAEAFRELLREQAKPAGRAGVLPAASLKPSPPPLPKRQAQIQPQLLANTPPTERHVQVRFLPLLEKNADIVGWLNVLGGRVDYPVVQADDNDYYLTRDIEKSENVNGSIFMDYRNRIGDEDKHIILYGHNMKNRTMFAPLLNYESRSYFQKYPVIEFDTLYGNHKWQIFSVHFTDTGHDYIRTDFDNAEQYFSFIRNLKGDSLYDTGVELSKDDTVLTLSTCAKTPEGRFAVHAKLLN